ncbi:hypothetical protein DRJ17_02115 [Candidatus Woesearchaeota archaeon]|nr:MAG: hypothetical protein DRJ17_02115 [Candidatus Woesearchaeota archaeon]
MATEQELLEQQKKQCIMCKIVSGEISSRKVYEDDLVVAVLDIRPVAKGHILLMPKEHYQILPILPLKVFTRLFSVAKKLMTAQVKGVPAQGSTLFISNGFNFTSGQQFPHVTVHIIPRDIGDGISVFELSLSELLETQLEEIEKPISANLKMAMNNYLSKIGKPQQRKITREEVLQILNQNPDLKKIILEDSEKFKKIIDANPQLKQIFGNINIDEISEIVKKEKSEQIKESKVEKEKEKEKTEEKDKDKRSLPEEEIFKELEGEEKEAREERDEEPEKTEENGEEDEINLDEISRLFK